MKISRCFDCDMCGSRIRDTKYPWYSYYSPKGDATDVIFRYCTESKNKLQTLYGIDDSYFSRAASQFEEEENIKQYEDSRIKHGG